MTEPYVTADGLRWLNRGPKTDDHLAHGGHERELGPILRGLYKPGTTYVNIGAHVGTWALRMASSGTTHTVAVEGNPSTFGILQKNVALNNFSHHELTLCREILWDSETLVYFTDAKGVKDSGSTRVEQQVGFNKEWGYDTTTLDDLLARLAPLPTVGLIQMDVEGAEARILRGGVETISRDKPVLLVELHEGHPGTDPDLRQQVVAFLEKTGYSWSSVAIGVEEYLVCLPDDLPEFTDIA